MKDINEKFEILKQIDSSLGMFGVALAILIVICFFASSQFLKTTMKKIAEEDFNKNLELFKSSLLNSVGKDLLERNSGLSKEINSIKLELELLNKNKFEIKREERNSVISVNAKMNSYANSMFYAYVNLQSKEDCERQILKINSTFDDLHNEISKLELFISDPGKLNIIRRLESFLFSNAHKNLLDKLSKIQIAFIEKEGRVITSEQFLRTLETELTQMNNIARALQKGKTEIDSEFIREMRVLIK